MSGGHFDYLCYKDAGELFDRTHDLQSMAEVLEVEFPGSRAALDTRLVLEHIRTTSAAFHEGPLDDLKTQVWKAIEWWKSCDYSREQAEAAVAKYDAGRAAFDPMPHEQDRIIEVQVAFDAKHLERLSEFSLRTFGPGARTEGVLDHIGRELAEIRKAPTDLSEWADAIILAFDGALRTGAEPQAILDAIVQKQTVNEARDWPDWRTQYPDKAIEHKRAGE